jgi:serine protease AprX
MPRTVRRMALQIPRDLVENVLLGPMDDRRQLQDSPILGDVWIAYAERPLDPQDVLITPFKSVPAGRVANHIAGRMRTFGKRRGPREEPANIAYLQGVLAARLYFEELMRVVLPITNWWCERAKRSGFAEQLGAERIRSTVERVLTGSAAERDPTAASQMSSEPFERYIALTGLFLWACQGGRNAVTVLQSARPLDQLSPSIVDAIANLVHALFQDILKQDAPPSALAEPPVWQISLNRKVSPALDKSVAAIKADAAATLFRVKCDEIAWAVIDSGIDGSHPAFANDGGDPRIVQGFDFRNIRRIISLDDLDRRAQNGRLDEILKSQRRVLSPEERRKDLIALERLATDAREGRPIHWELVEEFVRINPNMQPYSPHGTHVAGIIGAREIDGVRGICPDINLYDFRILSRSIEDTEFAVIAALQYIRHLNERSSFVAIHGVNLSISIPHDVRNFACGQTPVCNECERLVDSGVVVVAAAGNRGYHRFETRDGPYEGYAAFSITDPGNADGVITVGATHRYWPHTYGVSFFSSRGPTGDGRPKPDLVAPGERIRAPMPGNAWGELDGTSMAAPHVSGAAAMLMARYSELIGRPRQIKRILCDTATDLGRDRSFQGRGMLDVLRAFQSV